MLLVFSLARAADLVSYTQLGSSNRFNPVFQKVRGLSTLSRSLCLSGLPVLLRCCTVSCPRTITDLSSVSMCVCVCVCVCWCLRSSCVASVSSKKDNWFPVQTASTSVGSVHRSNSNTIPTRASITARHC